MRVVLIGPPGAGKGTQAAALRIRLGVPHISTGDMLREAISARTVVGEKARGIVEAGRLVPDDVMAEIVRERLEAPDAVGGFLLDGYPRNLDQAQTLDGILEGRGKGLDHVLHLALEDSEIIRRLSGRRTCESCNAPYHVTSAPPRMAGRCDVCGGRLAQRPDDKEEVVAERLKLFRERTQPLVDFYRKRGVLRDVDATGSITQVQGRLEAALGEARIGGASR